MPAQTFVLTQTPTKILDGTKAGYVQEIVNTGTRFTVSSSNTAPDTATVPYCKILRMITPILEILLKQRDHS